MPRPIVTLCMNPALDITTSTDVVRPTDKLRCAAARYDPGGGGINVAHVAEVLGASSTAVFPAGGPAGEVVTRSVGRRRPCGATDSDRRIDARKLHRQRAQHGAAVPVRASRPAAHASPSRPSACCTCAGPQPAARIVVASGSLPPGVPEDFYQQVATVCAELGKTFLLDTSGGGLTHVTSGVFLLKPSVRELRE